MDVDIVIVGGGLAGACLAVALRASRLKVALVEARVPVPVAGWDQRIYALSPVNQQLLESLGIWGCLDASRLTPVQEMRVYGDAESVLKFSAYEEGLPELAWIVESGLIQRELWETLRRQHNVELIAPASVEALQLGVSDACLTLDDGRSITARLVVGADGANSKVRLLAGIRPDIQPYQQSAVVANFRCEKPHRNMAYQWFTPDGVLAYLPLADNRMSMVWSVGKSFSAELLLLESEALCEQVAAAGQYMLGALQLETGAAAFPLRLLRVKSCVKPRLALIGDAAHAIHPLSGHGINLGFQDAAVLARMLVDLPQWRDPGDLQVLRAYARSRAEEPFVLQYGTHALHCLFGNENALVSTVRNMGLNLANRLPVVRSMLVRYATGSKF